MNLWDQIRPIVVVKNEKVEDDILCQRLSDFIVTSNIEVHVDMGELEKKEVKTKECSLIKNEYCKKKCKNEKHEDSLWPRDKNERKVKKQSYCERVSEVKSICL